MRYVWYLSVFISLCVAVYMYVLYTKEDKNSNSHELGVYFLNIGQGDATYITFADGRDMLIDCSMDGRVLEALGRVMSWKDRVIDYLVLTHPDLDHYGGCEEVLTKFEIRNIWYTGFMKSGDSMWESFLQAVEKENTIYTKIISPFDITIASSTVSVLYPVHDIENNHRVPGHDADTGSNNTSVVMRLVHGEVTFLFTGDAEAELEEYLVDEYGLEIDADILKLGHHGSESSSIGSFLESVSPVHSIASAGKNNKFKHPALRVVRRVERVSSTLWRTDVHGDVAVLVDSAGYRVVPQFLLE